MRVLILNADYADFLRWHYGRNPRLTHESYTEQLESRYDTLFGKADFYSRSFKLLGHEATEIFANNIWLQSAWARENGMAVTEVPPLEAMATDSVMKAVLKRRLRPFRNTLKPIAERFGFLPRLSPLLQSILLAQIEEFRPDVILNQDIILIESKVLSKARDGRRQIVAQCGTDPPSDIDLSAYDIGISLIPWVVDFFRSRGLRAENRHLAFDPTVLDRLGPAPEKDVTVSFVGGLSSAHGKRIELLEAIAREFPIALWLSNFRGLPVSSPLHEHYRGEVWGRDMYNALRRSKITLNSHIDAARGMAGNMRLYEATGVGTFLLTDNLPNLPTLFVPGAQVGVYDSVSDCLKKIERYLGDDAEREAIAQAGQAHTLGHHTYRNRAKELISLIESVGR
jgi:hypothetical protein